MANPAKRFSWAWLLPLAVLSIPGLMYYFWWNRLDAQQSQQADGAHRHLAEGSAFGSSSRASRLSNPIAASASSTVMVAAKVQPPPTANPNPSPLPAAPAVAAPKPQAPAVVSAPPKPASVSASAAAPAVSSAAAQGADLIVISRDPMLSPMDMARLEQVELERKQRELEIRGEIKKQQKREPAFDTRIELEGIVSSADGNNKAIINGEMVGVGDMVLDEAKVLKITSDSVVFLHGGRRFVKTIGK
jgi:hypothetical protein